MQLRYRPDMIQASAIFGASLNYVGEFRQRIWPLFLYDSVVGSKNSGFPRGEKIQRISDSSSPIQYREEL